MTIRLETEVREIPGNTPVMTPFEEGRGESKQLGAFNRLFADEHHIRSDIQMARRAIREGWPMSPEDRLWIWTKATEFRNNLNERIAKAAQSVLAVLSFDATQN